jgi:hypothetical protein
MKIHFKPQMSQINADGDVADNRSSIISSSLNHLRTSASSASSVVDLLQSEGEK